MTRPRPPSFAPDTPRPHERVAALHLVDLDCTACSRRAESVLHAVPGVGSATVRRLQERADVRYDPCRTSERELAGALAAAGFHVAAARSPARPAPAPGGIAVAVALVALANLILVDAEVGPGPIDRLVGLARIVLAALSVGAVAAALGAPAMAILRRGILDRDAIALAGAGGSFAAGAAGQRWGFVAAAGIAASALSARFAQDLLRKAAIRALAGERGATGHVPAAALDAELRAVLARLAAAESCPASGSWDEAAVRGLVTAALGCASFALVTHGCFGGGPLGSAALSAAIAVLVVASPSAILAAAPAARAIAVMRARAAGVAVKDAAALEALAAVDVACLEKNGAVTSAALAVRCVVWAPGTSPDLALLADVAALEQVASHPAGRAIAAHLARAGIAPTPLGPDARIAESHHGVSGRVRGALVEVGATARFRSPARSPAVGAPPDATVALFGRDGVPLGRFELHAPLRPDAAMAVHELRARGVRAVVTSGDRPEATALAARHLRVPGAGGLGPAEKALAIRDLQLGGARVVLVGDGRDDPRVAAQADLSVAVAPFTPPGAVRAPIVLCRDDLDALPGLVDLGRALRAVIRQNAALAAAYNAILIPAAALGYVSPLAAGGLALVETLIGLGNAARLIRRPAIAISPPSWGADRGCPAGRSAGSPC